MGLSDPGEVDFIALTDPRSTTPTAQALTATILNSAVNTYPGTER